MADLNTPWLIIEAIEDQLSAIALADGYNTDIGQKIYLYSLQRSGNKLPSIAIGVRSGVLDRSGETRNGKAVSAKARSMAFTIEAAAEAPSEDAQRIGLKMLDDVEKAWAARTCLSPLGLGRISLDTWQILDRPDGMDAVVLQILGTAEYVRAN